MKALQLQESAALQRRARQREGTLLITAICSKLFFMYPSFHARLVPFKMYVTVQEGRLWDWQNHG